MTATARRENERFAELGPAERVWGIAAIHGEATRLVALHDRLRHRFRDRDRLVYLGNYLGRGAAVRETVDELLRFRREVLARPFGFAADLAFLRGSQEEMWQKLLQLQFAGNPREVLEWMLDQGMAATLAAYGGDARHGFAAAREGPLALTRWTNMLRANVNALPGHGQVMSALRRAAFSHEGRLLFVHAGIDPTRPLDAQGDIFWWGGGVFLEMTEPYAGFGRVVRGFDRKHAGLVEGAYAASLDGGCGFGGELLAACFGRGGTVLDFIAA